MPYPTLPSRDHPLPSIRNEAVGQSRFSGKDRLSAIRVFPDPSTSSAAAAGMTMEELVKSSPHHPARRDPPRIDDFAVAHDEHLVHQVHRGADVIGDDLNPVADRESGRSLGKGADGVLLA